MEESHTDEKRQQHPTPHLTLTQMMLFPKTLRFKGVRKQPLLVFNILISLSRKTYKISK